MCYRWMQWITQTSFAQSKQQTVANSKANSSGAQKQAPTIGELSKEYEHVQTMHVRKQYRLVEEMILQSIPVVWKKGNRKVVVNARLDDGSTKTFVNEDVAAELRLKGPVEQLQVNELNKHSETLETMSVQIKSESLYCSTKVEINAYTANRVTGNMRVIVWRPQKVEASETHTIPQH